MPGPTGSWCGPRSTRPASGERHAHVRELPPDGPSAPDASGALATRDALERAFDRLTPEQRAVVVLHHYAGFP